MSAIAAAQADERKCERCGGLFLPARADAKFCSGRCRVAAHRAAGSLSVTRPKPPEPLEPLAVTAQSQGPAPLSVTESEPLSVTGSGRSVTKTAPEPPASVTSPAADVRQSADDETLVYETLVSAPIAEPEPKPPEPPEPRLQSARVVTKTQVVTEMDPELVPYASFRPAGYSDAEWKAALADAKRLGYGRPPR